MPIPYIPLPSAGTTQINATAPNLGAMTAVTRGLSDTVQGISNVAASFDAHADRIQAMENTWQESEARQAIARDFSQFETSLDTNNDPSTYLPQLEKALTRTGNYTANEALTPQVRDKLTLFHSEFANNARIRVAERAASMTTKRASMAIQNELDAAMQWGNREAFDSGLDRGITGGLILPEQADKLRSTFDEADAYNQAIQAIDADPLSMADDLLNPDLNLFPGVSPEARERLNSYAIKKKNSIAAETWKAIQIASLDGKTLTREEITQMAKDGDISPVQAGRYIKTYHGTTPPDYDPLVYNNARSMLMSYDPAKDPTGAIRANIAAELATTPLPKEYITELQTQFEARSNPDSPDAPKHRLAAEYNKRIESEWQAEAFGEWYDREKDPVDGRFSRKIYTEKEFDRAMSYKVKFEDAFNSWLNNQDPKIDPVQVGEQYLKIKSSILKNEMPPPDLFIPSAAPLPTFADPLEGNGTTADGSPAVLPMPPKDGPKTSSIGTFGGQPVPPPGVFIKRAATSIFGGNSDPEDNGLSANGGPNNDVAGVAIPQKMLQAMFPGKDKNWHFKNVKIVVKADNGVTKTLPLRDYGTAEWVTQRERNHKLDLNPKAVAALGGQAIFKNGKLVSHSGFKTVDFAITTDNAANLDPKTTDAPTLKSAWFKDKKPTHPDQIESGLAALNAAQALASIEA